MAQKLVCDLCDTWADASDYGAQIKWSVSGPSLDRATTWIDMCRGCRARLGDFNTRDGIVRLLVGAMTWRDSDKGGSDA